MDAEPQLHNPTDDEQTGAVRTNGAGDDRSALLGEVKAIRQKIAQGDFHKDIALPGTKGLLIVRFRPYAIAKSEKKARALGERSERGEPVLLDASCDTIIDACEQVMVKGADWPEPRPIDDDVPVKFDARLAELLDIPLSSERASAREVVKALFPTEQSITAMAMEVTRWLNDVTKEVDQEFVGE